MTTITYDGTQQLEDAVVRFTADWCAPCKAFAPVFDTLAEKSGDNYIVVDVEDHPDVAQRYNVRSIPFVLDHGERHQDWQAWARQQYG